LVNSDARIHARLTVALLSISTRASGCDSCTGTNDLDYGDVFNHSERVYSDTPLSSSPTARRQAHVLGRTDCARCGAGVCTEASPAWAPSSDATALQKPLPGNLDSYRMPGTLITTLDGKCVPASLGSPGSGSPPPATPASPGIVNSPYCSWSTGTTLAVEVATLTKNISTAKGDVGLNVAVEAEEDGVKGKAGLKLKYQMDGQWGTQSESKLKSSVTLPDPDEDATGTPITSYTFYTFMLSPDPSYAEDLVAILAYADPEHDNATLSAMILPGAQAWKITYGVI
jgi:hypothetical protein